MISHFSSKVLKTNINFNYVNYSTTRTVDDNL